MAGSFYDREAYHSGEKTMEDLHEEEKEKEENIKSFQERQEELEKEIESRFSPPPSRSLDNKRNVTRADRRNRQDEKDTKQETQKEVVEKEEQKQEKDTSSGTSTYDKIMNEYNEKKDNDKDTSSNDTSTRNFSDTEHDVSEKESEIAVDKQLKRWEAQQEEIDKSLVPDFKKEKQEELENIKKGTNLVTRIIGMFNPFGAKATQIAGQGALESAKNETLAEWRKDKYSSDLKTYQGGELIDSEKLDDNYDIIDTGNDENSDMKRQEHDEIVNNETSKDNEDTSKEDNSDDTTDDTSDDDNTEDDTENPFSEDYSGGGGYNPFTMQKAGASSGDTGGASGLNYAHIGIFFILIMVVYWFVEKK